MYGGERSVSRSALLNLGEIVANYSLQDNGWAQGSVWTLRRTEVLCCRQSNGIPHFFCLQPRHCTELIQLYRGQDQYRSPFLTVFDISVQRCWHGSIGIATCSGVQTPVSVSDFLFASVLTGSGTHQPCSTTGTGGSLPGLQHPRLGFHHPSASSAQVQHRQSYACTLPRVSPLACSGTAVLFTLHSVYMKGCEFLSCWCKRSLRKCVPVTHFILKDVSFSSGSIYFEILGAYLAVFTHN